MERNNQTAYTALVIILVAAILYFGVFPRARAFHDVKVQAEARTLEAQALTNRVAALTTLQSQFASQTDDLQRLQIALPKEAKPEEIIVMLDSMATKSGVTLDNLQPAQTQSADTTTPSADVTATVTGDYNSITQFTSALNANVRPIIVRNITLVAQDKDDGTKISGTFDLGFLIVKTPAATATQENL